MKVACLGFVLLMSGVASLSAGGYRLLKSIPVPGDGGWDFLTVDVAARRLYEEHKIGSDQVCSRRNCFQGLDGSFACPKAPDKRFQFLSAGSLPLLVAWPPALWL